MRICGLNFTIPFNNSTESPSRGSPSVNSSQVELAQIGPQEDTGNVASSMQRSSSLINRYKKNAPALAFGAAALSTVTLAVGSALRDSNTGVDRGFLAASVGSIIGATTLGLTRDVLNTLQPSRVRKAIALATGAAAIGCTAVLGVGVSKSDSNDRRPLLWAGGGPIAVALLSLMVKEAYVGWKGPQQIDVQQRFLSVGERLAYVGFLGCSLTGAIATAVVGKTNNDDLGHFQDEAITPAIWGSLGFLSMNARRFFDSNITSSSRESGGELNDVAGSA